MSRSNRPRRGGGRSSAGRGGVRGRGTGGEQFTGDDERDEFAHLRDGLRHTEFRRGTSWTVQPISAARAQKSYSCPGCGRGIGPGVAHLAVWRADFVLGDAQALDGRRHWHTHCWKIA